MSCAIKRILQFTQAVQYGPIQVIDCDQRDVTTECMYSWSNDMVCWTSWTDYPHYQQICKNIEDDFYLRILLFGSFDKVSLNNLFTNCYTICLDQSNPFLESLCNENTFRPYQNLDCAIQLQQQLADSVICMFGIPIYYFKVKPNADTADYTFKEYVLHNVESVKQINLMIPDGTMPSSNPKFTALDFDWQTDWDVEIGKTEFATAFGDEAFPKVRDFIYIPMMKRMWDVNTAYDEKNEGLMWRSTTWKLSLVKYEDSTSISSEGDIQALIDNWTVNDYDDVFGKKEIVEQERLTGASPLSSPTHTPTNLYNISMQDSVRQAYSKDEVTVVDYQYNHHSNVVARTIYKFKKPTSTITYQNGYCGKNGTLSFIIQTQGLETSGSNNIVIGPLVINIPFIPKSDNDDAHYNLTLSGIKGIDGQDLNIRIEQFNTYLVIVRWNKDTYSIEMSVHKYVHEENMPKYMLRPEMYWFETDSITVSGAYNLDLEVGSKQPCYIQPYPCLITNIKLYNMDLGEDAIKESIKYTTQHPACVINDLARHFATGHGYAVR